MENMMIIDGCNPSNWKQREVIDNNIAGGVTAANATTVIWHNRREALEAHARWAEREREEHSRVAIIRKADDLRRVHESPEELLGIVIGWQNITPIENDLSNISLFHSLGLRIAQLAYNYRNLVANGCYEQNDDGLSRFGVEAVAELNQAGVLIDLSHVGDGSSRHAIEVSERPVAFTHCNSRRYFDHPRNKPIDLIKLLVEKGGVIGANQFPRFLKHSFKSTLSDYLDSIEDLIDIAGIDHVGIASDFCECQTWGYWQYLRRIHGTFSYGSPEVPRPDPTVEGLSGSRDISLIAEGLLKRGYSSEEVAKVMGANWLSLYEKVWAA